MDIVIFVVGVLVSVLVVFGIFAQVPQEIAKADPALQEKSN